MPKNLSSFVCFAVQCSGWGGRIIRHTCEDPQIHRLDEEPDRVRREHLQKAKIEDNSLLTLYKGHIVYRLSYFKVSKFHIKMYSILIKSCLHIM